MAEEKDIIDNLVKSGDLISIDEEEDSEEENEDEDEEDEDEEDKKEEE